MKITGVVAHPVSAALPYAFWTAAEPLTRHEFVVVEVRTDEGIVGCGQAYGSPLSLVASFVERFGAAIVGVDPCATEEAWERMMALTSPRSGAVDDRDGWGPPLPRSQRAPAIAAIGGIDTALWDLKGKAAGMPLWRLLGGSGEPILAYAAGGHYHEGVPMDAAVEELAGYTAAGWGAVKLKSGAEPLAVEEARIAQLREAIGDALLMVDINAAWSVEQALEGARALAPHGIVYFEEPLHWFCEARDYGRFSAASPVPAAQGDRDLHRFAVRDLIEVGRVGYVRLDVTVAGGFTEAVRIAQLAGAHGTRLAPHNVAEIHGHLLAGFRQSAFAVEVLVNPERDPVTRHLYREGPRIEGGWLHLSSAPGLGLDYDWDFVRRMAP
ncbi:MAG: mandelate racemase/muconate lactonizing enzyme family protein [Acetobacterales bacterium]